VMNYYLDTKIDTPYGMCFGGGAVWLAVWKRQEKYPDLLNMKVVNSN
jgi:hypothetical protein